MISLNSRIALAHAVAESLMYLHSVSWIHKSIRSDNILFFPGSSGSSLDLENPILSGFGYARPDHPSAETEQVIQRLDEDMYRPPECQEFCYSRSKKSHDIYALGVVLVEIAYWKLIEAIMGIDLGEKGASKAVRVIQQRLLTGEGCFLQSIGEHAGETYARVVQRCLTGGPEIGVRDVIANEEDSIVGTEMVKVFSEEIVGRLRSIKLWRDPKQSQWFKS
jgi:serine/threonine protein kinase